MLCRLLFAFAIIISAVVVTVILIIIIMATVVVVIVLLLLWSAELHTHIHTQITPHHILRAQSVNSGHPFCFSLPLDTTAIFSLSCFRLVGVFSH